MKGKTIFTFFILLIVFSFSVSASFYCRDSSCTGESYFSNEIYTYNGDSFPASGGQDYKLCTLPTSIYKPIAYSYNGDTQVDVVLVTDNTTIKIYNSVCNNIATIITPLPIISSPSLVNPDYQVLYDGSTPKYDLAVATNTTIYVYNSSGLKYSYFLNSIYPSDYRIKGFTCTDNLCWVITGQSALSVTNITTLQLILGISASYNKAMDGTFWEQLNRYDGMTSAMINGHGRAVWCGMNTIGSYSQCYVFDEYGNTTSPYIQLSGTGVRSRSKAIKGILKLSGSYYYAFSDNYYAGSQGASQKVYSSAYGQVFTTCANSNCYSSETTNEGNYTSFPVVADYDKDGNAEYCYFQDDASNQSATSNRKSQFLCYDSSFSLKYNVSVNTSGTNGNMFFPSRFVMGDFNQTDAYLYIGVTQGIYKITPTEVNRVYSSNQTITNSQRFNDKGGLVVFDSNLYSASLGHWIGNPVFYYSDEYRGFALTSVLSSTSCGDGICNGFESILTCAKDCLSLIPSVPLLSTCSSDADCNDSAPYTKCLACGGLGQCVSGYNASVVCSNSAQCPTNAPVCYSGKCIAGVHGTVNSSCINENYFNTPSGNNDFQSGIGDLFNTLLGGSSFAKFIFAIIVIIAVVLGTYGWMAKMSPHHAPPVMIPIIMGFITSILLAIFGFIPVYVIIITVLGTVGIFALSVMLKPGQA